jgi:hypothetical protein
MVAGGCGVVPAIGDWLERATVMIPPAARVCVVAALSVLGAAASPAFAQLALRPQPVQLQQSPPAAVGPGELHGTIQDDKGQPLSGAVVSALGSTTVFAVSDREGRFAFRSLPAGPYLVRAHLKGFAPPRARVVHVTGGSRQISIFSLSRVAGSIDEPSVLTAGISDGGGASDEDAHDHGEVEWRLRHATRSVLKEAEEAIAILGTDDSLFRDPLNGLGRAVGNSARIATALFADLSLNGQVNLLTTTSFDRPQDLFSMGVDAPQGIAYVSVTAPGASGDWTLRGTITQGDLASWMVASSYVRHVQESAHQYEAGVSYSMQRYMGGNSDALFAMRDGSRNAGGLYAYDTWSIAPRLRVGYGGRYARYEYMPDRSLVSPRGSVIVQPLERDSLKLRATLSHRETAPGDQEFLPPSTGLWLPPERTFSQVSREAFRAERVDHVEVAAEREWPGAVIVGVRAFRQRADDQVVTLFGVAVGDRKSVGHYHVGSAGDFDARGWGVSVSRSVTDSVRASVDYTHVDASWYGRSPDAAALAWLAASVLRTTERLHDVTASIESVVSPTSTRVFAIYRMNTGFAQTESAGSFATKARFNVQVNQALPFLRNWEMLVAVSNLFREDALDGSVYDEVMVVNPPKRVLGGVSVRF